MKQIIKLVDELMIHVNKLLFCYHQSVQNKPVVLFGDCCPTKIATKLLSHKCRKTQLTLALKFTMKAQSGLMESKLLNFKLALMKCENFQTFRWSNSFILLESRS